mmetsp:Transcript_8681/g.27685  ORF Transcript_8681/g.27685 Transcript_8681/m.27685 type:complete len:262 (+) Transcript_8681:268-1053(+)
MTAIFLSVYSEVRPFSVFTSTAGSSKRRTTLLPSASPSTSAATVVLSSASLPAAAALASFIALATRSATCLRAATRRYTGMRAASTAAATSLRCVSHSSAGILPKRAASRRTCPSSSSADWNAWRARSPVRQTTRRMPCASAPSETVANALACEVLRMCVPPQNSIEYLLPQSCVGSASKCSTGRPIDTTRTGSGYFSPKTAVSPLISRARSSGTSAQWTCSRAAMTAAHLRSTSASCSGVTGPSLEKSKRATPASTLEPR